MAENPIADSRDTLDNGVRPGVPMGNPSAGGNNRFSADLKPLQELDAALTKLNTNINKFKTDLPKVITLTEQWAAKMQKVANAMNGMSGGGGGGGYIKPAGSIAQENLGGGGGLGSMFHFGNTTINTDRSQNLTMLGGGGGGGGGAKAAAGDIARQISSALADALNNRINTNAGYSLSANRMDMLYQQTTGMSGQDVRSRMREPLTQYKLGAGGINSVLALQASTGIDASKQGSSVEFLRAASGYGYSTDQVNQMTKTMASAESANRMFMTMGTGMYGIGGQQRSSKEVVQQTVQRLGLTTQSSVEGAMAPGSMTRERMRQSGIPEEMQDITLQYAKQNIAFKKKGGKGMYDASNAYDRKLAGVEDSYANQNEETERVKMAREENMYDKQADNYAAMEKGMQSLTKALQKLDDTLSGLTGFKARNRAVGGVIGGALKGIAPGLAMLGPYGIAAGAVAAGVGSFLGDPTGEKGSGTNANTGDKGNVAKSSGQLSKLHPRMREKVEAMMKENPRLYIGGGVRSTAQQKEMFMSRYQPTTEKTDVFWKGQYWKRVRGAAAAPPGMSMHEIGLAVDFAPATEFDWVKDNAKRFGLRSFHDVNNEPWHVQPAELPGSRSQYEKMGAPWGHNGVVAEPTDTNASIKGLETMMHGSISSMGGTAGKGVNIAIQGYAGLSMGAAIEAMGLDMVGAGAGGSVSAASLGGGSPGSGSSGSGSDASYGSGPLTGAQVAAIMYKAGFRGKRLVEAVAIAHRESRFNPRSLANDSDDLSYGLMQINMKGTLGPGRRKTYKLKKNEDLFNPAINARVAWKLSGHGNNWDHWKTDSGNPLGDTNIPQATKYVKQAGYATSGHPTQGDPVSGMGMNMAPTRGGSVVVQGDSGNTFHVSIAPTINLNGGNNYSADIQRMAKEVSSLLDREVRMALLRNS